MLATFFWYKRWRSEQNITYVLSENAMQILNKPFLKMVEKLPLQLTAKQGRNCWHCNGTNQTKHCTLYSYHLTGMQAARCQIGTYLHELWTGELNNPRFNSARTEHFQYNSIADPTFFHPGSEFFPSRIRIFSIPDPWSTNPKNCF